MMIFSIEEFTSTFFIHNLNGVNGRDEIDINKKIWGKIN